MPNHIPARSSIPLTVRFDSHNKSGPVAQSAFVALNDGNGSELTLPLRGNVTRDVTTTPSLLNLDNPSRSANVVLKREDGQYLQAKVDEAIPDFLRVSVTPISTSVVKVTVEAIANKLCRDTTGPHAVALSLHTNHPRLPTATIDINWTVPSRFLVQPASVNFGTVAPGMKVERTLTVTLPKASSRLKIKKAPPGVSVIMPDAKKHGVLDTSTLVHLAVRGTFMKGGIIDDGIVLSTGDPREPYITVPVVAAVGSFSDKKDECRVIVTRQ